MEKTGLINRALNLFGLEKRSINIDATTGIGLPYGFSSSPLSIQTSLQLSAVYRCVDVIGDSIASQSWQVMEYNKALGWVNNEFHDAYYMLNNEPNKFISRFTFIKTLVAQILLNGNGYAIIRRDGIGNPISLDLVTGNVIMYRRRDGSIYYEVQYSGYELATAQINGKESEIVEAEDMIHILNFSYDGLMGVSTLRHAANSMSLSISAEASARGFFRSGANMSGILTTEKGNKLTKEKSDKIKESWRAAFNVNSGDPGGVAVLESGLTFDSVTVNPKDQQLLEIRGFNVIDICRFFGVPPAKCFEGLSQPYANIESYQLGFITDCISPWDTKIEAEFNRKLFRPSQRKFTRLNLSIEELLRANLDAKSNYISKMFQSGGYTVNEVRKAAGNPRVDGGDEPMVQANMLTLSKHNEKEVKKVKQQ
jgi:HK97 family phage portal protein